MTVCGPNFLFIALSPPTSSPLLAKTFISPTCCRIPRKRWKSKRIATTRSSIHFRILNSLVAHRKRPRRNRSLPTNRATAQQLIDSLCLSLISFIFKQTSNRSNRAIKFISTIMLLPSALPCEVRRSSRFTPSRLFSTPPPSDTGFPSGNGLLGTCRALQSLLNRSPTPSSRSVKSQRLQSPLPLHTPRRSPRSQKAARPVSPRQTPPPRTAALSPPPPPSAPTRGANKRRRDIFDDDDSDAEMSRPRNRFATPKRRRHVPYNMPLGLSSTDFYSLHSPPVTQSPPSPPRRQMDYDIPTGSRVNPDAPLPSIEVTEEHTPSAPQDWTPEEDQHLLELVLEKFSLSQQEWDECARQMGRSHVGPRWQSLVGEGRVGLRPRRR